MLEVGVSFLMIASLGQIGTREEKSPHCDGNEMVPLDGFHGNPPNGVFERWLGIWRSVFAGHLVLRTIGQVPTLQRTGEFIDSVDFQDDGARHFPSGGI